ncbi:hypothetical protein F4780DRAFT_796889 [Xylariomycetidae sp. FL0641]|nr:hypothetical protein F4780DRAFT_796889 [Xylariomycetidae sp. FL0641]
MAVQSDRPELPVLIIGAGICGLIIAHGLHINNIPYRIFDQEAGLNARSRARDWGLGCHWGSPILKSLLGDEKWTRIAEAYVDPSRPVPAVDMVKMLNGATGAVENEVPFANFQRFLRSRLRALIAEGLPVEYGKKLATVEYDSEGGEEVTARFADGTAATGRLLVGADGAQSTVRQLLLGPEAAAPKRLPFAATFINASFPRPQALFLRAYHPIMTLVVHPDGMVGLLAALDCAAGPDRPESWRFMFYISRPCSPDAEWGANMDARERLRQAKETSKAFADPLRSAHEWVAENCDEVFYAGLTNWDPEAPGHGWDSHGGRVTLAGDAAHPMTYHRGQGLNHALADAGHLVELLVTHHRKQHAGPKSMQDLIARYEAEMRPRAGDEVRSSEQNTAMLHDWERVKASPLVNRALSKGSGTK